MLESIEKVTTRRPGGSEKFTAEFDGRICQVQSDSGRAFSLLVEMQDSTLRLRSESTTLRTDSDAKAMVIPALDLLLGHLPAVQKVIVTGGEVVSLSREEFYQSAGVWNRSGTGEIYRRYIPETKKTLSLRAVDLNRDLERFHRWQNIPYVAALWELNQSVEELKAYLEKAMMDVDHLIPLILEVDDEPVGYVEIYWAERDRIAPYYEVEAYDRGFHFLIGDRRYLGRANTGAAIRSIMHLLYLDEPRTGRIVAEPRSDNAKVLKYVQLVPGWRFMKEFDFPHKRAALLMAKREDFFSEGAL